jgi:hypothetical protein
MQAILFNGIKIKQSLVMWFVLGTTRIYIACKNRGRDNSESSGDARTEKR